MSASLLVVELAVGPDWNSATEVHCTLFLRRTCTLRLPGKKQNCTASASSKIVIALGAFFCASQVEVQTLLTKPVKRMPPHPN